MSCAAKSTGVATLTFHLDSDTSQPFLTIGNKDTGNWTRWTDVTATVDPAVVKGIHRLYVKFSGQQKYAGNYDYFRFYRPDSNPLEERGPLYMLQTTGSVNEPASSDMTARARAVARRADVVVFLGGTNFEKLSDHATGTESHDRFLLTLPGRQEELLKAVYEVNPRVVLVLETNSSVDITWAKANIPAILDAWYGGQAQGQAICDVLFGDYNPGGKLTTTWYNSLAELPAASDSQFRADGMLEYNIDEWGYTYMYYGRGTGANVSRQAEKPMYPFGYGLSYTTFEYSHASISNTQASCIITNTGNRRGAEVVQVYATFPDTHVAHRPQRKLVGFQRVELEPGESQTVTIPIRERQLAYWDATSHSWQVEGGTVGIHISASSADDRLSGSFVLTAHQLDDNAEDVSAVGRAAVGPAASPTCFDLAGRPVSSPAKGIYLIDGKKIIKQ